MLERISLEADRMVNIDKAINRTIQGLLEASMSLIGWLFVPLDLFEETKLIEPIQFFNPSTNGPTFYPQFIFLRQRLRFLCSYAPNYVTSLRTGKWCLRSYARKPDDSVGSG